MVNGPNHVSGIYKRMLNRVADIQIALHEAGIGAAGKYLSIFKLSGEDLGNANQYFILLQNMAGSYLPHPGPALESCPKALNKYGGSHVKLMLHSDGAFRPFIPDIIAAGVQILDPIQSNCPGMELAGLKKTLEMIWFFTAAWIPNTIFRAAVSRK